MKQLVLAAVMAFLVPNVALAQHDALAAGEQVFNQCADCHAVGEGAKNKVGPVLNNVFGRTAGSLEDYKYSTAMVEAGKGGLVWTPETMAEFVKSPREFVKGTKMTFAGLKEEADVQNLIAYLLTFSPDYVPAEGDAAAQ